MPNNSFQTWQEKTLGQRQTASATLLALAGGALAFATSLLAQSLEFVGCFKSLMYHFTLIANGLSIGAGVGYCLNRARDFSLTAKIARNRDRNPQSSSLRAMRRATRRIGSISKRLYLLQVALFFIGMTALVLLIFLQYAPALYASAPINTQ